MARELPDSSLRYVRLNFDDAYILNQVSTGNMTAEDAAAAFDIFVPERGVTAPETIAMLGSIGGAVEETILTAPIEYNTVLEGFIDGLWDTTIGPYVTTSNALDDYVLTLESFVTESLNDGLSPILAVVEGLQADALELPTAQVHAIEEQTTDLTDKILGFLGDASSEIIDALGIEAGWILESVTDVIEPIGTVTDTLVTKTLDFATALRETIPEIGDKIVDGMSAVGGAVTEGFGAAFDGILDALGLKFLKPFFEQLQALDISQVSEIFGSPPREEYLGPQLYAHVAANLPQHLTSAIPFVGAMMQMIFGGQLEITRQLSAGKFKPTLLGGNELAVAERRGITHPNLDAYIWHRLGFDDYQIEIMRDLTTQYPDIGTLIRWEAREIIGEGELHERGNHIGWTPNMIDKFKQEYEGPPPIGDLIRMVVRDAFEQTVVDEGKLSEGFEEFPIEYARQVGLTDFWSEKYWQAHWMLPSLGQGFEMLHRLPNWQDDEGKTRLEALFKAADLAPGYWDDMKALSYRPYTRVDVRRMNAFDVLDKDEVLEAYKQLGYDAEKAGKLRDFTLDYNESIKKGAKSRERDLSKSDVIGMYNDGVLDADTTRGYLKALGYDEAEATVLIEREDIQEMRRDRKADISNIIDQAKITALTYEESQDRLAALDLTRTETTKALADLARVAQTRTRTPTKADLDDWLELRLITEGDYAEELRTLGYADRYVALYVEATTAESESDLLAEEAKAARRREPRSVSKSNLDSLYQAQIINVEGYTEGLQTLGYRPADIANLLEQQTLRLDERLRDEAERIARGEEAAVRERLPSRGLLGKLFLKELIDTAAYEEGLTLLGFSPENIELLSKLIGARRVDDAS